MILKRYSQMGENSPLNELLSCNSATPRCHHSSLANDPQMHLLGPHKLTQAIWC